MAMLMNVISDKKKRVIEQCVSLCLLLLFQSLDEVNITVETCEFERTGTQTPTAVQNLAVRQGRYRYDEHVLIDNRLHTVESVHTMADMILILNSILN